MNNNQGLPEEFARRYRELISKRQKEVLTPEEYQELLSMGEQVEHWQAEKIQALAGLAQKRGISLRGLLDELGIDLPFQETWDN